MLPLPLLILLSVLLSTGAQLLLKRAASDANFEANTTISFLVNVITSKSAWLGLASFGLSLAFWVMVLARVPVSKAYPFVAIGILITSSAGIFFYGEPISMMKVLSIFFIALGVSLLAVS